MEKNTAKSLPPVRGSEGAEPVLISLAVAELDLRPPKPRALSLRLPLKSESWIFIVKCPTGGFLFFFFESSNGKAEIFALRSVYTRAQKSQAIGHPTDQRALLDSAAANQSILAARGADEGFTT